MDGIRAAGIYTRQRVDRVALIYLIYLAIRDAASDSTKYARRAEGLCDSSKGRNVIIRGPRNSFSDFILEEPLNELLATRRRCEVQAMVGGNVRIERLEV